MGAKFELMLRAGQSETTVFHRLAESQWWKVQLESMAHPVLVRFGKGTDGRLVCTGVLLGSERPEREVSSRSLRDIPLGEIVGAFSSFMNQAGKVHVSSELSMLIERTSPSFPTPRLRPGPKGHPRDHFEMMAASYRRALMSSPRSPVKVVAKETGYSEATVRRHLQRARDMHVLEPAPPGKAGEQPKPKATRPRKRG